MSAYKTIVKIGSAHNVAGDGNPIYSDSFEAESCSYSFDRGMTVKGNHNQV